MRHALPSLHRPADRSAVIANVVAAFTPIERRGVKFVKLRVFNVLAGVAALAVTVAAATPATAQTSSTPVAPALSPMPPIPTAAPGTTAPPVSPAPSVAAPALPAAAPPAAAPPAAAPPAVLPPGPGQVRVRIVTGAGTIVVDLDRAHAPLTTANFLRYADQHRFDGTTFYRADMVDRPSGLGLIQGGVRGDPKRSLPPVAHESTIKTGLAHGEGTISMARLAPGTAHGDFFITTGPLSALDAHPQASGDNAGFAAFGQVVDGMDVVRRILSAPVGAGGEGAMRGQLITKPVKIVTVRRGG